MGSARFVLSEAFSESQFPARSFTLFLLFCGLMSFGLMIPKYYHAPKTLPLKTKDGKSTSLEEICKSAISPGRLNPLLFNGHLQTVWTLLAPDNVPIYYKRRIFESDEPIYTGIFAVDFVTKPNDEKDASLPPRTTYFTDEEFRQISSSDSRPMLVILHGLSGGSHELYLRHLIAEVMKNTDWEVCVVTSRGCSQTKITSTVLYNARATWDMRQTVKWLKKTFPNRPLFGAGFSLGANIITNYIGEEGANCALKAAVVLSNPWNLEVSSLYLRRTLFRRWAYSRTLGYAMKQLFQKHQEQIVKNPKIDLQAVMNIKHLYEFDRVVQGPTWGYPTEGAYYRDAASVDSLLAVRIPFLAIHAEDDPVACNEALPRREVQQTPYGVLCTTKYGGHLGWFQLGGRRWFATASASFLNRMATEIDLESYSKSEIVDTKGQISRQHREPLKPQFDPMQRKLHLPE